MKRSQLISFKIEPNLDRMWRAMGISKEEREEEIEKLEEALFACYEGFIAEVAVVFEEQRDQLRQVQDEFRKTKQIFGDTHYVLPTKAQLSIREQIAMVRRAISDLTEMYESRIDEFNAIHEKLTLLFDELGIEDRGEFADVGGTDLSNERLLRFKQMATTLENDKIQRETLFNSLKSRIEDLLEELCEEATEEVQEVLRSGALTNDAMKLLNEALDLLEELRTERETEMDALNNEIEELYLILAVDPSDRIERPTQKTQTALEMLRDEAEFLREQKDTRLPQVIKGLLKEINKICDQLRIPARMRPRFGGGGSKEEEAAFLREKLDELREKKIQSQPIINVIIQIESCKNILDRPAPTDRRKFAEEEREKKKARDRLPKFEQKLLELLLQFKETNGYDFEFNGVNCQEAYVPEGTHDAKAATRRKREARGERQQTLGEHMLMQKISESMTMRGDTSLTRNSNTKRLQSTLKRSQFV